MWDVEGLMDSMSSRQLTKWMIYAGLEPFGQQRGDLQAGIVAATMVNLRRTKQQKPSTPGDFLLQFEDDNEQDPEEGQRMLEGKIAILRERFGSKATQEQHAHTSQPDN